MIEEHTSFADQQARRRLHRLVVKGYQRVVNKLAEDYVQGALTADEFRCRVDAAHARKAEAHDELGHEGYDPTAG